MRVPIGQQPPSGIIQGRGGATESCENIYQFFLCNDIEWLLSEFV